MPVGGMEYGLSARAGREKSWRRSWTPPLMSPPTQFGLYSSNVAGGRTLLHRNTGRLRSVRPTS